MSTISGWTCPTCGVWTNATEIHYCLGQRYSVSQSWQPNYTDILTRIAGAVEQLAGTLAGSRTEEANDDSDKENTRKCVGSSPTPPALQDGRTLAIELAHFFISEKLDNGIIRSRFYFDYDDLDAIEATSLRGQECIKVTVEVAPLGEMHNATE